MIRLLNGGRGGIKWVTTWKSSLPRPLPGREGAFELEGLGGEHAERNTTAAREAKEKRSAHAF